MKVLQFNPRPTLPDALSVIEALRRDIQSGKIIAFTAVAIDDDDRSLAYMTAVKSVTRLRLQGAVAQLQYELTAGSLD